MFAYYFSRFPQVKTKALIVKTETRFPPYRGCLRPCQILLKLYKFYSFTEISSEIGPILVEKNVPIFLEFPD